MFPILPLLILFLMGPANAERLAVEGRLPAALLAVHRSMVSPVCATVIAPVEETETRIVVRSNGPLSSVETFAPALATTFLPNVAFPSCPTRAGPSSVESL